MWARDLRGILDNIFEPVGRLYYGETSGCLSLIEEKIFTLRISLLGCL